VDILEERVTGRVSLQGPKHILWDELIEELFLFTRYLIMIDDKERASTSTGGRCNVLEENLQKNPKEKAQNSISFMNTTQGPNLVTLAVNDKNAVLVATKKVVEK